MAALASLASANVFFVELSVNVLLVPARSTTQLSFAAEALFPQLQPMRTTSFDEGFGSSPGPSDLRAVALVLMHESYGLMRANARAMRASGSIPMRLAARSARETSRIAARTAARAETAGSAVAFGRSDQNSVS